MSVSIGRRYRGRFEVYYCLLRLLSRGPAKKTHVMNACNLNSQVAKDVLGRLVESGITSVSKRGRELHYRLTDRGMMALLAAEVFVSLVESPPSVECRKRAQKEYASEDVVENAYLGTSYGLEVPVSYYSPGDASAAIVAETDSGLVAFYYAMASMLSGGNSYLNNVTIFASGGLKERLEDLFKDDDVVRVVEC
ncbi:MAG: hypothetical protein F7C33_00255 [Desulfurococcales archaeon]|nr:hypothetical protein [Desulfurococcales archaeon]